MNNINKSSIKHYVDLAKTGTKGSIEKIMMNLDKQMTLAESKFIDFALSNVETEEGTNALIHYLFRGTQIQRNYCALYFGRKGEYQLLRKAYDQGLIDAKQAFSR